MELTVDCLDRIEMVVDVIAEAKAENPLLRILGALPLSERRVLSAQEQLLYEEFRRAFARHGFTLFETTMYRSPSSVAVARSNFDESLLHWTARRRFDALLNEITTRIHSVSPSPPHDVRSNSQAEPSRTALAKAA